MISARIELQGNRLIHSRRKKHFKDSPRASEGTGRARTLTNVFGRASRVDY